jgi:hypothetical protein
MVGDQLLDPTLSRRVAGASLRDKGLPFRGRGDVDRLGQDSFDAWCGFVHGAKPVPRVSPHFYA